MASAATDAFAWVGAAFTIDALLARLAAQAIANLTGEAATETLGRTRAFRVFVAACIAARLGLRAALLVVDACLALLAADTVAHNLIWRTASDAIFADLALLAADFVADDLIFRATEACGIDARIGRLATMFRAAPDETFRAADADVGIETRLSFVAASNVSATHRTAGRSGRMATLETGDLGDGAGRNSGSAAEAKGCRASYSGSDTASNTGCGTPALARDAGTGCLRIAAVSRIALRERKRGCRKSMSLISTAGNTTGSRLLRLLLNCPDRLSDIAANLDRGRSAAICKLDGTRIVSDTEWADTTTINLTFEHFSVGAAKSGPPNSLKGFSVINSNLDRTRAVNCFNLE